MENMDEVRRASGFNQQCGDLCYREKHILLKIITGADQALYQTKKEGKIIIQYRETKEERIVKRRGKAKVQMVKR